MEIMGGLIKLDKSNHIPIPWFMRSHLGLETGTRVRLALTRPDTGAYLPDIVVSPLDPYTFWQTASISITVPESMGALHAVLEKVDPSLNVALADSVTVEGRTSHRVNIVLEPVAGSREQAHARKLDTFIRLFSASSVNRLRYERVAEENHYYRMNERQTVREGFVPSDAWLAPIKKEYPTLLSKFDLTRLVVSSNPDQRLLRYIIPRKGAFSIEVPHQDEPGVLRQIANQISKAKYNILASRLSRTPPQGGGDNISVFVAECEPGQAKCIGPETLARNIMEAAESIREPTIRDGIPASQSVYLLPRNARIARIQDKDVADTYARLRTQFLEPKKHFRPQRRQPVVFVSRRFLESWEPGAAQGMDEFNAVLAAVRLGITEAGWRWIEATADEHKDRAFAEVYAPLWLANRFLIFAFDGHGGVDLSAPQGHELGFASGQNKKTKIIVPERLHKNFRFPNHPDNQLLLYKYPTAVLNPELQDSIVSKLKRWLRS